MKIHVYLNSYNDSKFLFYALRHYSFANLITVWDNCSTDHTIEIIKSFPNTDIVQYYTENQFDDLIIKAMKNNWWKNSRGVADWVIVADLDEFLYHPDIINKLIELKEQGYTIIKPTWYDMVSETFPIANVDLTDIVKYGVKVLKVGKSLCFNPNLDEIHYNAGAHFCKPIGRVKIYDALEHGDDIKTLHYKYLGLDYVIQRRKLMAERMSKRNKELGLGFHAFWSFKQQTEKFNKLLQDSIKVI
jgi:glycosyltransferase involved in cell wall biosynthesis